MDEESRRERILLRISVLFPRHKTLPPFTFGLEKVVSRIDREGWEAGEGLLVGGGRGEMGIGDEEKVIRWQLGYARRDEKRHWGKERIIFVLGE
jgi:hypothetical protein